MKSSATPNEPIERATTFWTNEPNQGATRRRKTKPLPSQAPCTNEATALVNPAGRISGAPLHLRRLEATRPIPAQRAADERSHGGRLERRPFALLTAARRADLTPRTSGAKRTHCPGRRTNPGRLQARNLRGGNR